MMKRALFYNSFVQILIECFRSMHLNGFGSYFLRVHFVGVAFPLSSMDTGN